MSYFNGRQLLLPGIADAIPVPAHNAYPTEAEANAHVEALTRWLQAQHPDKDVVVRHKGRGIYRVGIYLKGQSRSVGDGTTRAGEGE